MTSSPKTGYSAVVNMALHLQSLILPIAQMGPGFVILAAETSHPPCEGRIELDVDDDRSSWQVKLPEGIRPGTARVRVVNA